MLALHPERSVAASLISLGRYKSLNAGGAFTPPATQKLSGSGVLLRSLRGLSSEPRLYGARDTLSELAYRAHQLHIAQSPIFLPGSFSEGQFQKLLAMHG